MLTHTRASERSGRQSATGLAGHSHGVEHTSQDPGVLLAEMGKAQGGFLCHKTQLQAAHLCVASARFSHMGGGCAVHQLGGVSSVCVPFNSDHSKGASEATSQVQHGPAGPSVTEAIVVFHSVGVAGRLSSRAARRFSSRAAQLLRHPRSSLFYQNPVVYRLHTWKLSRNFTEILLRDFHKGLQNRWRSRKRSLPSVSTRRGGMSSVIGVKGGIWIHSGSLWEM